MVRLPVEGDGAFAWLPSLVELRQGSSRDEVLSDLRTGAREPAGILQLNLEGSAAVDRAGLGTLRRRPSSPAGISFTRLICPAAKLFTSELPSEHGFAEAVLPRLCITLEMVSAAVSAPSKAPSTAGCRGNITSGKRDPNCQLSSVNSPAAWPPSASKRRVGVLDESYGAIASIPIEPFFEVSMCLGHFSAKIGLFGAIETTCE
jgi:hypothetical protein